MADRREHWAALEEKGVYAGLRFMAAVYRLFGRWVFVPILHLVVAYFYLSSPRARAASRRYLDLVYATETGRASLGRRPNRRMVYRHMLDFGRSALDKIAGWMGDISLDDLDYENHALYEAREKAGKGGVWITSHIGNIEACRALARVRGGTPLNVLVHTHHAANFNRLLAEINPEVQVRLIQVSEFNMAVAMHLQALVDRGEFIAIMGDRIPVSDNGRLVRLPFLGHEARFPIGAFVMASVLRCPVGLLFVLREGRRFRLVVEDGVDVAGVSRRDRPQAIERAVAHYASRLEWYCERYPMQWYNFYDFWGEQPPPEAPGDPSP